MGNINANLTVAVQSVHINPDGSTVVSLGYTRATGNTTLTRTIFVPANRSSPIVDANGVVVSSTVPVALGNAIDSFNTSLANTVTTAAGAGKLDL